MKRRSLVQLGILTFVCAAGITRASAQDTRAEVLAGERAAKAEESSTATVQPQGRLQRTIVWASNKFNGAGGHKDGFYPELGGLIPGNGWPSAGPGYRHHLFGGAVADVSAAISMRRYSMVQSQIEWPTLFSDRLSVGAGAKYQDATQINYFGIGRETSKGAQSDYRLKSADIAGSATYHPNRWLSVGGRAGYLHRLDVGSGLSSLHPSTDEVFDETTAPGLTSQPRYRHADLFVQADSRDVAGYPSSGGVYRVGVSSYADLDRTSQSFQRVDADATQYLPLFHHNWIVALRGRVAMSQTAGDNQVPFYLLPTLGGENTLRGYSNYRFRDRNVALLSAEYRWPVFRMMDAAIFGDAGTVAATAADLWRERPMRDYGFSLRLHSPTSTLARVDVARGPEGMRLFLSFSAPLGTSSRNVTPYVP